MNFLPSLARLKLHEAAPTEGKRGLDGEASVPKVPLVIHPNRHIILQRGQNSDEQEAAMRAFLRKIASLDGSDEFQEEYVLDPGMMADYIGATLEIGDVDNMSSFPEMLRILELYMNGILPLDTKSSYLAMIYRSETLYFYGSDATRPDLPIVRHGTNSIDMRPYQTKVLERFFPMKGVARSGIGIVPCGAGKTLIGILATLEMQKSTIVFCPDKLSVDQWYKEFLKWTQIPSASASRIQKWSTGSDVVVLDSAIPTVLITTYSLMAARSTDATRNAISSHSWGLALLDEVHKEATSTALTATLERTTSACKIGLTATFVRENESELDTILERVGPLVVEVPLKALQEGGYIATVKVIKFPIPMPQQWKAAYDADEDSERRKRLRILFPAKIRQCKLLMRYHEEMGHRVLIFVEEVGILQEYSRILNRDFIDGSLRLEDQVKLVARMKNATKPSERTLLFNSVGDASLDIPNADVIIELSRMGRSQRQAGQRAGRVQRSKCGFNEGKYYVIYSPNSDMEVEFVEKRMTYLMDMGYAITETKAPLKAATDNARAAIAAGNTEDPDAKALSIASGEVARLLASSGDQDALFQWVRDGTRPPVPYPVPWRMRQLPQGRG